MDVVLIVNAILLVMESAEALSGQNLQGGDDDNTSAKVDSNDVRVCVHQPKY